MDRATQQCYKTRCFWHETQLYCTKLQSEKKIILWRAWCKVLCDPARRTEDMILEEILEGQCFSELSWDGASRVGAKELPFCTHPAQPAPMCSCHCTNNPGVTPISRRRRRSCKSGYHWAMQPKRGIMCSSPNRQVAEEEAREIKSLKWKAWSTWNKSLKWKSVSWKAVKEIVGGNELKKKKVMKF